VSGIAIVGFLVMQVFPMGRVFSSVLRDPNPPAAAPVVWTSAESEAIVRKACYDCHSNETVWPWYSNIAPVSWLTTHDVNEGRAVLNFSDYDPNEYHLDPEDIAWHVNNDMPLWFYIPLHPESRLSDAEKEVLIQGIVDSLGSDVE
jgi:hypothetical protein